MSSKQLLVTVALFSLCTACGSDSQSANSESQAEQNSASEASQTTLWRGAASGYVHASQSNEDRIALFIQFGRLLGAVSHYHRYAGQLRTLDSQDAEKLRVGSNNLAAIFSPQVIRSYQQVDTLVQSKAEQQNQTLDIQGALNDLSNTQQIEDVINNNRKDRDRQYAANQKVHVVGSRVRDAVLAFFPSRREYLLASSALIRGAGDKISKAVSADGMITNTLAFSEAYALIDQSIKLDPKNVSYCDAQRLPIQAHKDAIDQLLAKMAPMLLGQKLAITAADIYQLAEAAEQAGQSFPTVDSGHCN